MNRSMRRGQHDFKIRLLGGEFGTQMSCKESHCEAYLKGWFSLIDVGTDDGAWQVEFIKERSGRRYWEWDGPHALAGIAKLASQGELMLTPQLATSLTGLAHGLVLFAFPPGQECFRGHLDREVVFRHNDYIHTRPIDFNEDWNETADRVNTARERG